MRYLVLEPSAIATFPLTISQVKAQLRIDHDEFDSLIDEVHMPAAIKWAEGVTKRAIIARTHTVALPGFPSANDGRLTLPLGKAQSIASVAYITGGTTVTLTGPTSGSPEGTGYREDLRSDKGAVLMPPDGESWPDTDTDVLAPVVVTYRAGWEIGEIPGDILLAILTYIQDAIDSEESKSAMSRLSPWVINRW